MPIAIDTMLRAVTKYSNGEITYTQLARIIGHDAARELAVTEDQEDMPVARFVTNYNHGSY